MVIQAEGNTSRPYQIYWPTMAFSGCTDHEAQHGLRWLHKPLTAAWRPEAAKPEDITTGQSRRQYQRMGLRFH